MEIFGLKFFAVDFQKAFRAYFLGFQGQETIPMFVLAYLWPFKSEKRVGKIERDVRLHEQTTILASTNYRQKISFYFVFNFDMKRAANLNSFEELFSTAQYSLLTWPSKYFKILSTILKVINCTKTEKSKLFVTFALL